MRTILLEYPQYRDDIRISFKDLANKEMQLKEWLDPQYQHPYWDSLRYYVFGTLFSDHDLDDTEQIMKKDHLFYDDEEKKAVNEFMIWFDELRLHIGRNKPDQEYLNHPEWPKVWEGAAKIFKMMEENDKKYNFSGCYREWSRMTQDEWAKKFEHESHPEIIIPEQAS
jgi:hypothetical protein